ncbi:MAG: hypothetical protein SGJ11_15935 [Phycisphaerae bacterium]|nr:hypothetical protein [Phycisphaerae bacterium]
MGSMRKARLDRFVELARVYRGWSRSQLADRLGRDPSRVVPETGNAKLDYVSRVADALDWRLGDVVESIWLEELPTHEGEASFEELDEEAQTAHRSGDAPRMLEIARQMRGCAATATERAIAANREAGAWDLRGRYGRSLEAVQLGLTEEGVCEDVRLMLHANLANAHYTLWHLIEARSVAGDLVDRFTVRPATSRIEQIGEAFALYVRGSALRRSMAHAPPASRDEFATRARKDLQRSRDRYESLADAWHDQQYAAIAHTCRVAMLECEAALHVIDPADALQLVIERLGDASDLAAVPSGDWLESFGWWAIGGCNIALEHLDGHELHRAMAVCTNKALEIADRLDHWAMRERAFTMERFRRQCVEDSTGYETEWLLDDEDVRIVAGTMARFPRFRPTGWRILESARVFADLGVHAVHGMYRA